MSEDEGSNVEAAVSELAALGSYYAYRNGLGKSSQNAKGVNMTLENHIRGDGRQGSQVRFWPNGQLPDWDTQITFEINIHCVELDGTPYDVGAAYGWEDWIDGEGYDVTRQANACLKGDRIVLSRIDWTVDN
jgi:hypothetical protein